MTTRRPLNSASTFTSALQVYANRAEVCRLSTGSHCLDQLLGGVEPARFYLLYGSEREKVSERLLYKLMVETIKETSGHVIYMLCGNYRRDRTTFDSQMLLDLLESSDLNVEDSLSRIHIIGVFSESQLMNAPSLVEKTIAKVGDVRLLAVQQIFKLFYSETAVGFEDQTEFTGVISKLKELCTEHQVSLVATCEAKKRRGMVSEPMGGSYLRHAVNVMVYLRMLSGGDMSRLSL